jgi:hypothetical protein
MIVTGSTDTHRSNESERNSGPRRYNTCANIPAENPASGTLSAPISKRYDRESQPAPKPVAKQVNTKAAVVKTSFGV